MDVDKKIMVSPPYGFSGTIRLPNEEEEIKLSLESLFTASKREITNEVKENIKKIFVALLMSSSVAQKRKKAPVECVFNADCIPDVIDLEKDISQFMELDIQKKINTQIQRFYIWLFAYTQNISLSAAIEHVLLCKTDTQQNRQKQLFGGYRSYFRTIFKDEILHTIELRGTEYDVDVFDK